MGAPAPKTIAFAIRGPILPSDLPGLCDRVCALLDQQAGAGAAVCDVRGVEPDAVAVDALARLQVAAARRGCRITLRDASAELRALLRFLGLDDVLAEEPGASS
jgi:ABC-type transporter Mla MlaB component